MVASIRYTFFSGILCDSICFETTRHKRLGCFITGSGYFAKNKIFGTIAEANAPDRGQLFAQLGPIVLVPIYGILLYLVISKTQESEHLFFGIWIFATHMSWTAARFMFNATPVAW